MQSLEYKVKMPTYKQINKQPLITKKHHTQITLVLCAISVVFGFLFTVIIVWNSLTKLVKLVRSYEQWKLFDEKFCPISEDIST